MTSTEPALWTSAPTTGFKMPVIAKTIAMKFRAMENVKLHLMVTIMRFARRKRWGSSLMSSLTSAMSAASTAMSLPTPPMAMPTYAFFSAGASLMPSPIMQT